MTETEGRLDALLGSSAKHSIKDLLPCSVKLLYFILRLWRDKLDCGEPGTLCTCEGKKGYNAVSKDGQLIG